MDEHRSGLLTVLAVAILAVAWVYPIWQLPTSWSSIAPMASQIFALAASALLILAVQLRSRLSWGDISLLIPAVTANIVLGSVTSVLSFPIPLNMVGTVIIGVMLGSHAGATVGVATAVVGAIVAPASIVFASIYGFVGMAVGVMAQIGCFRSMLRATLSGFVLGIPNAILAAPLNALNYGAVFDGLQKAIAQQHMGGTLLFDSIVTQSVVLYCSDRALTFLISWCVLAVHVGKRVKVREEAVALA